MATQKFGIQNIQLLAKFAFSLTKHLTDDLKDGKIDFVEQLGLISDVIQGVTLVKVIPQIKLELKELSAAEKTQLRDYLISEFNLVNIDNKELDAQIKKTVTFALSAVDLIEGWKSIRG